MRSTDSSDEELLPPWAMYPELPRGSIGWRMGYGEGYYNAFCRMFSRLTAERRELYVARYTEPPEWSGLYAMIAEKPWLP